MNEKGEIMANSEPATQTRTLSARRRPIDDGALHPVVVQAQRQSVRQSRRAAALVKCSEYRIRGYLSYLRPSR
jgi:hypothetical protein